MFPHCCDMHVLVCSHNSSVGRNVGVDLMSSHCLCRYVERKNFLERVDHRQFELEKAVRLSNMKR